MERFQSNTIDGGFLQSEHWEKFQRGLGREVVRIDDESMAALLIFYDLPVSWLIGGYFFVPRGPVFKYPTTNDRLSKNIQYPISNIKKNIEKLIKVAQSNNAGWIRVEPQSFEDLELIKNTLKGEYEIVKSKKDHEPAQTLMVDLSNNEEEILSRMKPKTRYNIRLADKRGVEIFASREAGHVEKFIELVKITARRDGVVPHPDEYYRKMIEEIPEEVARLYFAKYGEEIISAAAVSFFGGVATYLHGASSNVSRNVMAPFALQWRAMQDAKRANCAKYDLGGTKLTQTTDNRQPRKVATLLRGRQTTGTKKGIKNSKTTNSWAGITRFKRGFCPDCQPVEFPGCWDIVISRKKYGLYRMLQGVKKHCWF